VLPPVLSVISFDEIRADRGVRPYIAFAKNVGADSRVRPDIRFTQYD
jgi:hypothetical protein